MVARSISEDLDWKLVTISSAVGIYGIYRIYKKVSDYRNRSSLIKIIRDRSQEKSFLTYSATKLALLIRSGELKSVEIVEECIKQAKLVEPFINCITDECFEDAINEALTVDKLIASLKNTYPENLSKLFEEKPLLGVPFYAKECFEIPGFNYTNGLYHMKGNKGKRWNPVVWRVKQSGAILLGSGNISEAAMWYESFNKVYGYSNNPYDLSRSVGGSSGGGCALVAALCAPFALTSDVGGSTRIPSLFNGLFGHKASGGSTPNIRNFNQATNMIECYCQMGEASRHIEDIITVQSIISGPITAEEKVALNIDENENPNAYLHKNFSWAREKNVAFDETVKIIVLKNQPRGRTPISRTERDQTLAREKVKAAFIENGNPVIEMEIEEFNRAFDYWVIMMTKSSPEVKFAEKLSRGQKGTISIPWELFKYLLSFGMASNFTFPLLGLAAIDLLGKTNPTIVDREVNDFNAFKKKMYALLDTPIDSEPRGEKVIFLVNSLPFVAPKHGPFPHVFTSADVAATCIFNVLELPATAIPTGLGSKKLPTGVQLVAGYGKDVLCLEAAEFLAEQGISYYELPCL